MLAALPPVLHVCDAAAPALQVGGLTVTEQRSHFSLWVMLSAPLILGNDPRHMTHATLEILTAPEVLAISQDSLAQQAVKVGAAATAGGRPLRESCTAGVLLDLCLMAPSFTLACHTVFTVYGYVPCEAPAAKRRATAS
jgi:hypothetical protein